MRADDDEVGDRALRHERLAGVALDESPLDLDRRLGTDGILDRGVEAPRCAARSSASS